MIIEHDLLDNYEDTAVIVGSFPGAVSELGHLMEQERVSTLAVFTGKESLDQSGYWSRFLRTTRQEHFNVVRFGDIGPEPDVATIVAMIDFLRDMEPESVLAIGGGSVMDAAKIAYLVHQAGGAPSDYFGADRFSNANPGISLKRVVCMPTTAGTGSEVTPYALAFDPVRKVKKFVGDRQIAPTFAFLIPELTVSMPRATTLATGLDALVHAIEGLLNYRMDATCGDADLRAETAIRLILKHLPVALEKPGAVKAREAMAVASCLAGMVIRRKPTSLPHLCSFTFTGTLPHGIAVAVLLPACWEYYLDDEQVRAKTATIGKLLGVRSGNPEKIIEAYTAFLRKCGVEPILRKNRGVTRKLLENTVDAATQNAMKLETAPKPVPLKHAAKILTGILDRAWKGDAS
jgi:alcohol dehydrogenase class IV